MNFKKILLIVMTFILSFSLFACNDEESSSNELLDSLMKGVIVDKAYKNMSSDLPLPDTAGGQYFIDWFIDSKYADNAVIAYDEDGFPYIDITQGETVVKFILVGSITDNGYTASREWECWIKADTEATKVTCAEVINAANNTVLQISGTVTYVAPNRGFLVQDETAAVYVYVNGNVTVEVGDTVTVKGTKTKNYDLHQLSNPAIVSSEAGTFNPSSISTPKTILELDLMLEKFYSDADEEFIDSVCAEFGSFYTVEGYIKDQTDSSISYKYVIEDALSGESLVLYDSVMDSTTSEAIKNMKGKYVSMSVVFWDTHSGGYGRFVPIRSTITEKTAPTYSDEDIVNATKTVLNASIPTETSLDLDLYTSNSFEGLNITWTSSNEDALSSEGKVGSSSNDTETVTLTAVITLNDVIETLTFEVVVKFPEEVEILDVLAACDANNGTVVRFKGKVVAFDTYDYPYIADETGIVYVRTKLPEDVSLGDVVKVSGTGTIYDNSGKQYTRQIANASFSKVEEEINVQEAVKVTVADLQKLAATNGVLDDASVTAIKESEIYGKIIEITGYVTIRGDYSNAFISASNDTESDAVLYYHLSANQEAIKEYEGKLVTIVCCLYDCQGNDGWRLGSYISISEVTEPAA